MQSNPNISIQDYKDPSTQTEEEFLDGVYPFLEKIDQAPITAARKEIENGPMLSPINSDTTLTIK